MNKKTLRWNFVFQYGYVLTNIINALILLPLYLKNIATGTLGVWLATGNILAWMTLADPGVGDVLQQKIAVLRGKNERDEIRKTIGSGVMASGIIFVIAIIAGLVFMSLAGLIINKNIRDYPSLPLALFISVLATGFSLLSFSLTGMNLGLQNSSQVAISSLLSNAIFLVLNIVLLFSGFGIVSIAVANLCRAVFINIYNITAMVRSQKKEDLHTVYDWSHFKKFIRIFSFTSAARIIGGFSASLDMIVLARFISPVMITTFEINKRPVQLTQSLVGRHSVALMPLISLEKGKENFKGIVSIIHTQFKYYSYLAVFVSLIFILNYEGLINTWTGANHFAGNTIMLLLVANFFFGLIGYFMANIGYALGDIKRNSLVNIVKGFTSAILLFFMAKHFGINGVLLATLCVSLLTDFFYFTFRLYKLGYLQADLIKNIIGKWLIIIPVSYFTGFAARPFVDQLFAPNMHVAKLIINCGIYSVAFLVTLWLADKQLRHMVLDKVRTIQSGLLLRKT